MASRRRRPAKPPECYVVLCANNDPHTAFVEWEHSAVEAREDADVAKLRCGPHRVVEYVPATRREVRRAR